MKVTERHYNPWNRARQERVEADVATLVGGRSGGDFRKWYRNGKTYKKLTDAALVQSGEWSGRLDLEHLPALTACNLFILHTDKSYKSAPSAESGYTAGTRSFSRECAR